MKSSQLITILPLLLSACGGYDPNAPIVISEGEPKEAKIGVPITIWGSNFGPQEEHNVSIGGNGMSVSMDVVEWSDTKIVAKIPDDPKIMVDKKYYYRVERKDYSKSSNLFTFSFAQ